MNSFSDQGDTEPKEPTQVEPPLFGSTSQKMRNAPTIYPEDINKELPELRDKESILEIKQVSVSIKEGDHRREQEKEKARHQRMLHTWTSIVQLILLVVVSSLSIYLVAHTAIYGNDEGKKLAFGLLGTALGVLWSNFSKLIDSVSKHDDK